MYRNKTHKCSAINSYEDLDRSVFEISDENGNVIWNGTEGGVESTPQGEAVSPSEGVNAPAPEQAGQENVNTPNAGREEVHEPTALERIPKDEQGNPIYEQADAETAFAAISEQTGNDIEAEEIAKSMVEDKEKALKKAQGIKLPAGVSVAEKVAASRARSEAIAKAQEELDKWKAIADVPVQKRAKVEEERMAQEKAEVQARQEAEEAKKQNEEMQ